MQGTCNVWSEGPVSERNLCLLIVSQQPFIFGFCISTLPTQHIMFIALLN